MPFSFYKLLDKAIQEKSVKDNQKFYELLDSTWHGFTTYLEEQMTMGKGVYIPNFGAFLFKNHRKGDSIRREPLLVFFTSFLTKLMLKASAVQFDQVSHAGCEGTLFEKYPPCVRLSYHAISAKIGFSAKDVEVALKSIFNSLEHLILEGIDGSLDFGLCIVSFRGRVAKPVFKARFLDSCKEKKTFEKTATFQAMTAPKRTLDKTLSESFWSGESAPPLVRKIK
ncbi:hypothetical protein ADUPG1_009588 [Aduncisulcus paluster]|uniref:CCDC81 HU domain-containing protein n=1 Tax=Aduncisulcus paluster TaxID=2918883 RepID=A0ABQ5L011_9EUKA|nr:hypothetical protein ADUPG1_009588 [Aduncisulcus paluster]